MDDTATSHFIDKVISTYTGHSQTNLLGNKSNIFKNVIAPT